MIDGDEEVLEHYNETGRITIAEVHLFNFNDNYLNFSLLPSQWIAKTSRQG